MTDENTGGPAFPMVAQNWHHKGMTLRDYFAAKAMQAMVTANPPRDMDDDQRIAVDAYLMADALLNSRDK